MLHCIFRTSSLLNVLMRTAHAAPLAGVYIEAGPERNVPHCILKLQARLSTFSTALVCAGVYIEAGPERDELTAALHSEGYSPVGGFVVLMKHGSYLVLLSSPRRCTRRATCR